MRLAAALLCVVTQAWTATANVEKTIFLGPSAVTLPHVRPSLDNLRLQSLSVADPVLATHLSVHFPSASAPHGLESWYLLHQLQEGRRYEVRICWPATSPTDFWLDTYPITHVFDRPELVSSLAQYSELRPDPATSGTVFQDKETTHSLLFLRIQAAASYYSTNRTLMEHPPPVDVDIILDPFILNVFPRSLGPVALYITAVAVGAWFISGYIYRWLRSIAQDAPLKPHTD
jgi:hypothetical protein